MKKLLLLVVSVFIAALLIAQVPESFNYQAVLRDASGNIKANTNVSIDIAILQGSATGTQVFSEAHSTSTNEFGLVSLKIGSINTSGFAAIDWTNGPYFVKVSVDGTEMGTSQLLSVPYALHSKTAESVSGPIAETDPVYGASVASGITGYDTANWNNKLDSYTETQNLADVISIDNSANGRIKNVTDPTDEQDATTKAYVDLIRKQINTQIAGGTVSDADGNVYNTVKIGDQIWMAENLKTTKYNDSTDIDISHYVWYNNDEEAYKNLYGALYVIYTDFDKICPLGWHVSSAREWVDLIEYIDEFTPYSEDGYQLEGRSIDAGGKLKENGTAHWKSPNTGATNEVGFTALPGGYYHGYIPDLQEVHFSEMGKYAVWWCYGSGPHMVVEIHYNSSKCRVEWGEASLGAEYFSVRCIKD